MVVYLNFRSVRDKMKAVIQRVKSASVKASGILTGQIGCGFVVLLGVEKDDDNADADVLSDKIWELRVFSDQNDKMNFSLKDIDGEILVVSNFTLCADCTHGRRPSFFGAASPGIACELYEYFILKLKENGVKKLTSGIFGADMEINLVNDGPVTIILDSRELKK